MLHALEIVRSGMPSARNAVYLNAGTWGPLPTRAADAMRARIDDVETRGRIGSAGYAEFPRIREAARAAFAEAVSSDPERIALTHSTSGGMNLVLGGLDVRAGRRDRHDRQRARGPARAARGPRRRYGVVVRVAEALHGADPLDAVAALIGPRTRLVGALARALGERPHPAAARDLRSRARGRSAACSWTAPRASARSTSIPAALGVDAYAGPGQKWLCGPNGVGFLWLADGFEERFEVAAPSYYTRDFRSEGAAVLAGRAPPRRGLALHGRASPGLAAAVEFRRELVGWSEGAAEMAGVRARCVELLSEVPGVTLQAESEGAAPLVAFTVAGRSAEEVVEALEESACSRARCPGSTGCASRSATGSRTAISSAWPPRCAHSP